MTPRGTQGGATTPPKVDTDGPSRRLSHSQTKDRPMDPREQKDLEALHAETARLRRESFDLMRELLRMDPSDLRRTGHKTIQAALEFTVRNTLKRLDAAAKRHLAKWPD